MYGAAQALYSLKDYNEARCRCENILRSHPDHVSAAELHLACIEGSEIQESKKFQRKAIIERTIGVAAIGLAGVVAGLMLGGAGRSIEKQVEEGERWQGKCKKKIKKGEEKVNI